MTDKDTRFARDVAAKAGLKLKSQSTPRNSVWRGFGMLGVIGWSVVLPTLGGAALGGWLDRHRAGTHSWTLTLLIAGLAIGCANAWHWIAREMRRDD